MALSSKRKKYTPPDVATSNAAVRQAMGTRHPQKHWMEGTEVVDLTQNKSASHDLSSREDTPLPPNKIFKIPSQNDEITASLQTQSVTEAPSPEPLPQVDSSAKAALITAEIVSCLPGAGTMAADNVFDATVAAEQRYHIQQLDDQILSKQDNPNPYDRYRFGILQEAVENRDFAVLFLNQLLCHQTHRQRECPDNTPSELNHLSHLLGSDTRLSTEFVEFCAFFPVDTSLIPDCKDETIREKLQTAICKLRDELASCERRLASRYDQLRHACKEHSLLPLAQDFARGFDMISPTLQRTAFSEILDHVAADYAEDIKGRCRTVFLKSQVRFQDHRPYDSMRATKAYRAIHNDLADAKTANLYQSMRCMADFLTVQPIMDTNDPSHIRAGRERFDPGSFVANNIDFTITRPQDLQDAYVYVDSLIMGSQCISETLPVQYYDFYVSDEDFAHLALKTADGPDGKLFLDFCAGLVEFRLRVCHTDASASPSESDWLAREMAWHEDMMITVNSHLISHPQKAGHHTLLPIDLSEVVVPGRNELRFLFTRLSHATSSINLSFAIERVVCTSAQDLYAAIMEQTPMKVDGLLTDPVSSLRIPVKGKFCKHDRTVNLQNFFAFRPASGIDVIDAWKCPICGQDARPQQLVVDEVLLSHMADQDSQARL